MQRAAGNAADKEKMMKKYTFILTIILFQLIVCGCHSGTSGNPETHTLSNVYSAAPLSAPEMQTDVSSYQPFVYGDSLYLFDWIQEMYLYRFSLDGTYRETIAVPSLHEESLSLRQALLLDNGDFLGLAADTEGYGTLLLFTDTGTILHRCELAKRVNGFSFLYTANDMVLLQQDEMVSIFSDTLEPVREIALENIPESIRVLPGKQGDTVYIQGNFLYRLDVPTGTCTEEAVSPETDNASYYVGDGYEYYLADSDGIYGISGKERTLLCHFDNSNLLWSHIEMLLVLSPDAFFIRYRDPIGNTMHNYILTPALGEEKIPIRIACLGRDGASDAFRSIVQQFNTSDTPYRAEIVNYNTYGLRWDDTGAIEQFRKDLLDGVSYDLYVFDSYFCAELYSTFANNGSLGDLSPLCDGLLPSLRTAFTSTGAIYGVPLGLQYTCLSAPSEREGSLEAIREATALCDTDTVLCSDNIRYPLMQVYALSLVQDANASLNSPAFVDFLKLSKAVNGTISQKYGTLTYSTSTDRQVYLNISSDAFLEAIAADRLQYVRCSLIDSRFLASYKLLYNEIPSHLIGFPTANGTSCAYGYASASISMPANASNPIGATAFLAYYVSDAVQCGSTNLQYQFPLTESALLKATEARYYYYTVEEIGNINIKPHSRYTERPAHPPSESSKQIREAVLTDEELEAFRDLIRSAMISTGQDTMVSQILSEELEPYFAGDRTAEATAEIIEKRVGIYLAE